MFKIFDRQLTANKALTNRADSDQAASEEAV